MLDWSRHGEDGIIFASANDLISTCTTEVQSLSFVRSTSEFCWPYALWNIQNLGVVPPYTVHSRSQSFRGGIGTVAMSWRQWRYWYKDLGRL